MKNFLLIALFAMLGVLQSCKGTEAPAGEAAEVQTPVTVVGISNDPLVEYIDLTAVSSYLQNSFIKSTANGFVKSSSLKPGEYVRSGQQAFVLQTKESKALGNTINELDPSFKFSGLIRINANQTGYIVEVNHQPGDYVQDGEQLAIISDEKSFGFLLNLPYEYRSVLDKNKTIDVELPDNTRLQGRVASIMPRVNSVSQTQLILIKVKAASRLPTNLVAKVRLVKNERPAAISLPKEAVLSDKSQTSFWIMKMIDSTTAVKQEVVKGLEADGRIEIIQPVLNIGDKIVLTGNYGLPDTAKVKVTKVD